MAAECVSPSKPSVLEVCNALALGYAASDWLIDFGPTLNLARCSGSIHRARLRGTLV